MFRLIIATIAFLCLNFSSQAGSVTKICVDGECGIVATSVADKFQGLFQDFKKMGYKLAPGCLSPGHMINSLHHNGKACDLFGQYARNKMRYNHPSPSVQIALAAKYGLTSGCEWNNRDCGHFDLSGYHGRRIYIVKNKRRY